MIHKESDMELKECREALLPYKDKWLDLMARAINAIRNMKSDSGYERIIEEALTSKPSAMDEMMAGAALQAIWSEICNLTAWQTRANESAKVPIEPRVIKHSLGVPGAINHVILDEQTVWDNKPPVSYADKPHQCNMGKLTESAIPSEAELKDVIAQTIHHCNQQDGEYPCTFESLRNVSKIGYNNLYDKADSVLKALKPYLRGGE